MPIVDIKRNFILQSRGKFIYSIGTLRITELILYGCKIFKIYANSITAVKMVNASVAEVPAYKFTFRNPLNVKEQHQQPS